MYKMEEGSRRKSRRLAVKARKPMGEKDLQQAATRKAKEKARKLALEETLRKHRHRFDRRNAKLIKSLKVFEGDVDDLHAAVVEQGERVRRLKMEGAPREQVNTEEATLRELEQKLAKEEEEFQKREQKFLKDARERTEKVQEKLRVQRRKAERDAAAARQALGRVRKAEEQAMRGAKEQAKRTEDDLEDIAMAFQQKLAVTGSGSRTRKGGRRRRPRGGTRRGRR